MPQGEPIGFILGRVINKTLTTDGCGVHKFKPLVHHLELDEIILDIGATPNNQNTAIARHHIEKIGNIRKLIEAKGYDEESALETTEISVTLLDNPLPERFADGDRIGFDGNIGLLQALNNAGVAEKLDMHNFDRLLDFANKLKDHIGYRPLTIDCYTNNGFVTANQAIGCTSPKHKVSTVSSIFIMRLITSKGTFLIFDCDIKGGQQTSGIAIKIKQEVLDLGKYNKDIRMVMCQLFENRGRLSNKDIIKEKLGAIKYFKHTNGHSINWVERVLSKF
ncbi:hypothetical protein [Psychrobacter sp. H7-1]|uniref:hypothetical protein n=1 Tax=Psychrobacter sp. H7-1 TaxID=1569265 RepID=UPI0019192C36|nr:hypothetical protein [Psychrobacter sp. H7-1]